MPDKNDNDLHHRLQNLLLKLSDVRQTPDNSKQQRLVERHAGEISRAWKDGLSIEELLSSDIKPTRDIKNMTNAVSRLRRAAKSLNEVGFFGGKSLEPAARDAKKRWQRIPSEPVVPAQHAPKELAAILSEVADKIEHAAKQIDLETLPFAHSLNGTVDWKGGRPFEGAARDACEALADAFEEIKGFPPTRINDGNMSYGLFLDAVRETLITLGSDANPDNMAKEVIKRRRAMENTSRD